MALFSLMHSDLTDLLCLQRFDRCALAHFGHMQLKLALLSQHFGLTDRFDLKAAFRQLFLRISLAPTFLMTFSLLIWLFFFLLYFLFAVRLWIWTVSILTIDVIAAHSRIHRIDENVTSDLCCWKTWNEMINNNISSTMSLKWNG